MFIEEKCEPIKAQADDSFSLIQHVSQVELKIERKERRKRPKKSEKHKVLTHAYIFH